MPAEVKRYHRNRWQGPREPSPQTQTEESSKRDLSLLSKMDHRLHSPVIQNNVASLAQASEALCTLQAWDYKTETNFEKLMQIHAALGKLIEDLQSHLQRAPTEKEAYSAGSIKSTMQEAHSILMTPDDSRELQLGSHGRNEEGNSKGHGWRG